MPRNCLGQLTTIQQSIDSNRYRKNKRSFEDTGVGRLSIYINKEDDIQYVSGNIFVPSKIEYKSFEDNEDGRIQNQQLCLPHTT